MKHDGFLDPRELKKWIIEHRHCGTGLHVYFDCFVPGCTGQRKAWTRQLDDSSCDRCRANIREK